MPANHHIDNEAKLIITKWDGKATDDELIGALLKYQEEFLGNPEYHDYNEIVDFSDTATFYLTIKGLKRIGIIATRTDAQRSSTRLAFVVNTTMALNLARLYATYRNFGIRNKKKKIRAFKDNNEAYQWILEP